MWRDNLLKELEKLMGEQQAKLDNIIGIRSELIEALRSEFENSSLSIAVDEKTGAISMDSNILFEYNRAALKSGGKDFLEVFVCNQGEGHFTHTNVFVIAGGQPKRRQACRREPQEVPTSHAFHTVPISLVYTKREHRPCGGSASNLTGRRLQNTAE